MFFRGVRSRSIHGSVRSLVPLVQIRWRSAALFAVVLFAACGGGGSALEVGACFDGEEVRSGRISTRDVTDEMVDCSGQHDNEVYHVLSLDRDSFPGSEAVMGSADEACLATFTAFVGRDYASSALDLGWLAPTKESWEAGDRQVACFVYSIANHKLVGSVAGSAA